MQIALLGDTHLGARSNCSIINDYFLRFFTDVFFPTLKSRNIETVIHLGDLGEQKRSINTMILDSWNQTVFKPLQQYQVWMLVGNHDVFYKHNNSISLQSSLELKNRFGFHIIQTNPQTIYVDSLAIDLIPWIATQQLESIQSFIANSSSPYLLGHLELSGFPLAGQMLSSKAQLEPCFLEKYRHIISGHFHLRSHKESVTYIGSPYEITWSDYNQCKGFALWDPTTDSLEFINNPHKLFFKLFVKHESDIQSLDFAQCQQRHVKCFIAEDIAQSHVQHIITEIESQSPLSCGIERFAVDMNVKQEEVINPVNTLHYIQSYVDCLYEQRNVPLDKTKLLQKLEEIYTQAQMMVDQE